MENPTESGSHVSFSAVPPAPPRDNPAPPPAPTQVPHQPPAASIRTRRATRSRATAVSPPVPAERPMPPPARPSRRAPAASTHATPRAVTTADVVTPSPYLPPVDADEEQPLERPRGGPPEFQGWPSAPAPTPPVHQFQQ
eukprot:scaffold2616_cov108-Cylindrotheca_fusiformis.AAC.1